MIIQTRDFGEVEVEESEIINFVQPILGFEDCTKFIFLVEEDEDTTCFAWLQSTDRKSVCFVLTNPAILNDKYNPKFPNSVEKDLGNGVKHTWLLTVINQNIEKSTVNLKSPIILNPETGKGLQIVLEQKFPLRQTIM